MLLQNLHHRYLYIVIRLPHLKDLDQKIPSFLNCDNYGIRRASNPNPLNDDMKTNDNKLHQWLCGTFKFDYLQEMDIITRVKVRLECKINITLPALLPNKIKDNSRRLVTSSDENEQDNSHSRSKRAIPLLAIAQGTAAIGGMLIKGINALVDANRASSFNNTTKMLNANDEITHNRLVTLENRTSMMTKAIMPVLKDLKSQINNTNTQLASQYRMMSGAHNRYNLLFRQVHKTQTICHATARWPPFPVNYMSWFPSALRGKAVPLTKLPYSVLKLSFVQVIGAKESNTTLLSHGKVSANQRLSHH